MFMSSPFRTSHRRTRSHTSLSSPSSSPLARSDKHRSYSIRSPLLISKQLCDADAASSPTSAFAAQPPEKWDVDAWRRGKRARHDLESPSEDADMESCDEPMPSSPIAETQALSNPLSLSVPSTPHPRFASTSDAFQFFPPKATLSSAAGQPSLPSTSFFGSNGQQRRDDELAHMRSEAFSDLRKTVSEAGEGFVRRMREFEQRRGAGSSRISTLASDRDGAGCRAPTFKRGRKRPSPLSARRSNGAVRCVKRNTLEEGESDIEIRSSCASGSDDYRDWSPSKKRAVSLSAISYPDDTPIARSDSLPFPITLQSRDRSSSPPVSTYSASSSDEDEDIISFSSSAGSVADRTRLGRAPHFYSKALAYAKYSPPQLSVSCPTSDISSGFLFGTSPSSTLSVIGGASEPPSSLSDRKASSGITGSADNDSGMASSSRIFRTAKRTEKAVAALTLALANGAGSVSDYEALRGAQGVPAMDDSDAGSLWD